MMFKIIILFPLLISIIGCTRAPVQLAENLATAGEAIGNAILDDQKNTDQVIKYLPPESRIPLTLQLSAPLDPNIGQLDVYLLHVKIKKIIDKQNFVDSKILFKPNVQYYKGTYYGDTLSFKYNYQGQPYTQNIKLTEEKNTLTLAFNDGKFEIIQSEFLIP